MTRATLGQRLIREPLLHFILLGAVLFGLDQWVNPQTDAASVITLDAAVDKEAREIFSRTLGREPTPKEMAVLRERWVHNEVLYREGLALGVDRGDPTIRERVIFKSLNVMQANLALPPIDDSGLQAWFEKNRAAYDEPDRFDFLEAVVSGDTSPAAIAAFVTALNTGSQSDARSDLRVFKARPRANLDVSYGSEFAVALEQAKLGEWQALPSKEGLKVVRLEARQPGKAAVFTAVQSRVYQDWKDAKMQEMRTVAVRDLGKKYQVRLEQAARS
ncbi:MAG: peptidylprolyl isomerase [Pseudomonadota bacterium]